MCGIVGVVDLHGKPVERDLVHAMNARIVHRGPDEDGFWFSPRAGLGMRRLSIMDLGGGSQPFANETGQVVTVYNGEIYNFAELRRELRRGGHTLNSNCDTEVIPHLFEDHGSELVDRAGIGFHACRCACAICARLSQPLCGVDFGICGTQNCS